ncbi:hypothetical protein BV25DRAFT_711280 [Artomyces pyxidatus]|uniref:Uncharacterized protein n=1 Tax=Artomyces pyxidatus TaxID=48021 RepID=A0ACB8SZP0_9AGAM|nr:hypothetical protein BV25DRAFT_711280 [Artomyces pyxidatus]
MDSMFNDAQNLQIEDDLRDVRRITDKLEVRIGQIRDEARRQREKQAAALLASTQECERLRVALEAREAEAEELRRVVERQRQDHIGAVERHEEMRRLAEAGRAAAEERVTALNAKVHEYEEAKREVQRAHDEEMRALVQGQASAASFERRVSVRISDEEPTVSSTREEILEVPSKRRRVENDVANRPNVLPVRYTDIDARWLHFPVAVSASFLSNRYGCNAPSFTGKIEADKNVPRGSPRRVASVKRSSFPCIPLTPGEPGVVFGFFRGNLDKAPLSLFVRDKRQPLYRYYGNYETTLGAKYLFVPHRTDSQGMLGRIRQRRQTKVDAVRRSYRTVEDEVLEALELGEEPVLVLLLRPISYDVEFQDDLSTHF